MNTAKRIHSLLTKALSPDFLEVIDESYQHQGGKDAQSHFKVIIVSAAFCGQRLIKRHRCIYDLLQGEMQGSVHALALHTYTADEWQDKVPASPKCASARPKT